MCVPARTAPSVLFCMPTCAHIKNRRVDADNAPEGRQQLHLSTRRGFQPLGAAHSSHCCSRLRIRGYRESEDW